MGGILGDLDVQFYLYGSGWVLPRDIGYHFDHWNEHQFYTGTEQDEVAASF